MLLLLACSSKELNDLPELLSPSDDPAQYTVDTSIDYTPHFSEFDWIVPSDSLPASIVPMASNNNVEIHFFEGKLYFAWRSAPTHFASEETKIWIISSSDDGASWDFELELDFNTDLREPRFVSHSGKLHFSFFEAGDNPAAFEPKHLWQLWKTTDGWSDPEPFLDEESVMWDIKERYGKLYMTTYDGAHYAQGDVYARFWISEDGDSWSYVEDAEHVYVGGVSEIAFEFDELGNLWAVGRNEDGDATGAGSQICFAPKDALSEWDCLEQSDPERYDSPELFRHGDSMYMLARRDIGGPFGPEGDLLAYSTRPKAFSLYEIDKELKKVVWLEDLPGAGDTAFASVRRIDDHTFRFANYTAPLDDPNISWFTAQTSPLGTQIYMMNITFKPN
ncbi:MAG: hypothetical protein CMK59_03685 [Proteobacteria bacterium]|nr:hypothetical protein [Pseudomonadota bacterium]